MRKASKSSKHYIIIADIIISGYVDTLFTKMLNKKTFDHQDDDYYYNNIIISITKITTSNNSKTG